MACLLYPSRLTTQTTRRLAALDGDFLRKGRQGPKCTNPMSIILNLEQRLKSFFFLFYIYTVYLLFPIHIHTCMVITIIYTYIVRLQPQCHMRLNLPYSFPFLQFQCSVWCSLLIWTAALNTCCTVIWERSEMTQLSGSGLRLDLIESWDTARY